MLNIKNEKYLVEKEASAKYGLSVHWFRRMRYKEDGPKYYKLRKKIYYNEEILDKWFIENMKHS